MSAEGKPPPTWIPSREEDLVYQRLYYLYDQYVVPWIMTRRRESPSPPWFRGAVKQCLTLQKLMGYVDADTAWLLDYKARFAAEDGKLDRAQESKLDAFETAGTWSTWAHPELKLRSEELEELQAALSVRDVAAWLRIWETRAHGFCQVVMKKEFKAEIAIHAINEPCIKSTYSIMYNDYKRDQTLLAHAWSSNGEDPASQKRNLSNTRKALATVNSILRHFADNKVDEMSLEDQLEYLGIKDLIEEDPATPGRWKLIDPERRDSVWAEVQQKNSVRPEWVGHLTKRKGRPIAPQQGDPQEESSAQTASSGQSDAASKQSLAQTIAILKHSWHGMTLQGPPANPAPPSSESVSPSQQPSALTSVGPPCEGVAQASLKVPRQNASGNGKAAEGGVQL